MLSAVHRQSVSTTGCPPNPARRPGSRCPAVRCPACPVSGYLAPSSARGCPAGWCPARPASSRLVSVRPPGRSRLVPRPPSGGDGETSVRRAAVTTGSSRVPCGPAPSPAARSTARGAWMRAPLRSRVQAGGGASAADLGRVVLRREAPHPSDRAGQTAGRGAVAGDCARAGEWLARCCRMAPCGAAIWAWSHDYSAWSLRSLTSEWTGPEGPNELGGEDGARPQRGPAR